MNTDLLRPFASIPGDGPWAYFGHTLSYLRDSVHAVLAWPARAHLLVQLVLALGEGAARCRLSAERKAAHGHAR